MNPKPERKARIVVHKEHGEMPLYELQDWSEQGLKWMSVKASQRTSEVQDAVSKYFPGRLLPIVPCQH